MKTSPFLLVTLLCFCCIFWKFVSASSKNITTTEVLRDSESIVSSNSQFRVGFFSPVNSTNRYVGIWYDIKDSDTKEVVWVANRNSPINDSSGVLKISEDGNLQLRDGQDMIVWSSNVSHPTNSTVVAQLLDTGNLVLLSGDSSIPVWQSSEHLTNSLLPQTRFSMDTDNMDENYAILQSWKSLSDPSSGRFRIEVVLNVQPEIVTWDGSQPYWRSGPWNGNMFVGIPFQATQATYGFRIINNEHEGTVDILFYEADKTFLIYYLLNYDGNVVLKYWHSRSQKWKVAWQSLQSECDYYGKCGSFGSCNPKDSSICSCVKGFEPKNTDGWSQGNWTSGCVRRTPLQCGNTGGKVDGFLRLKRMKVPDYASFVLADDQDECRKKCLENCSCLAYAFPKGIGCMMWNGSLIDMQQFSGDGTDLFIRLADSELDKRSYLIIVIVAIAVACTAVFCVFLYYLWQWRRRQNDKTITDNETNSFGSIIDHDEFKDLALFKFKELEVATGNFSVHNKLGEGGFGPVYKGKMDNGQEIAVKRLSTASGQGLQEFMNEALLISKLQHRNLVRLFGCCAEEEEKLLVYEYLPNGSLDALLFDPHHGKQLDWKRRFNIIDGICRGLLYLHRDSRLKIIHRDLKSSNILIDEDLNPKISDFGTARIFEAKQDEANTIRVVGTYGYMSPEYAMDGYFSEKSDIYSLGVLLLEIVSGRKNSSFRHHDTMNLLTYAWKLWNDNNMLSLIDPTIFDLSVEDEILKCIHLGLLCVQELPDDRPTISGLISMLDVNNTSSLPQPKQPGFTLRKILSATESNNTQSSQGSSKNQVSVTIVSGR